MHLRTITSITLAAITAAAASLVACSSDDTAVTPATDAGAPDTSMPATDAGAGVETGTTTTLYERLGKEAGITTAIAAIVNAELMDPDVGSFFAPNGNPTHRPQPAEIEACLVVQLADAAGGPTKYTPGTTSVNPLDAGTPFMCRSMADAHADLHIAGATFDKFVTIAAGVLTSAGVAPADIATIGGVLTGTKGAIVDADAGTIKLAVDSGADAMGH